MILNYFCFNKFLHVLLHVVRMDFKEKDSKLILYCFSHMQLRKILLCALFTILSLRSKIWFYLDDLWWNIHAWSIKLYFFSWTYAYSSSMFSDINFGVPFLSAEQNVRWCNIPRSWIWSRFWSACSWYGLSILKLKLFGACFLLLNSSSI